jgi:hydroxyacylglutathione hydrolase
LQPGKITSIIKHIESMLQVTAFTFNPFQENTYLIVNDQKECWIVDPGMYGADEERALIDYIESNGLKPQQIINTHAHIDHILGIDALKQKYNILFGMHTMEQPVLGNATGAAMLFGLKMGAAPVPDFFIMENENLKLGDAALEVRFTPGHSPGSIVFYHKEGNWLIGGDVLFNGSIGRTDLPGGNQETLFKSIREQLYTLPSETIVYSGHGPETTICREKQSNPFVRA